MQSRGASKEGPELFIGLVGALGAGLVELTTSLGDSLANMGYDSQLVRVSKALHDVPKWADLPTDPLDQQIAEHQQAGNDLRGKTGDGGAMAGLAIGAIQELRSRLGSSASTPLPNTAYIIRSLKHPDEVDRLRRVYGSAFFLVAAYSPLATRERELASDIARSRHSANWEEHLPRARELIQKDEAEENKLGQRVRDTFPLADVFVASHRPVELREQVDRFVEVVFDHPFHTPTRDEFAMFQAFSTMLRSSDLARQVGAVISTAGGDVVAVGTNEVPRAGGGSYWEGDADDARDFALGRSTSKQWRSLALGEVLRRLDERGRLKLSAGESADSILGEVLKTMEGTLLMNSGEFGRTVHAEMAALLDAARRGVRVEGCTLYTTTFPCHNCAKHIVAAGISRVQYIEPFPKSLAEELHRDAIQVEGESEQPKRVAFQPFVGIAPSRYADLFRMTKRRDASGAVRRWNQADAIPRYPDTWPAVTYPLAEDKVILDLKERMVQAGLLDTEKTNN